MRKNYYFEDEDDNCDNEDEMDNNLHDNIINSITFDDIVGYESIKNELRHTLDYIENPTYYQNFGVSSPKGILLSGVPGTGKTMLSSAFINASGLPSYILHKSGTDSDFEAKMKDTFIKAEKNAPCIILLDDMDKFAKNDDDSIFNSLQSLIDSVRKKDVYLIATVNHLDDFPRSLLRDGRFDTKIHVSHLTNEESEELIKRYLSKAKLEPSIDFKDIASIFRLEVPSSVKKKINKALICAAYKKKEVATISDFIEAISGRCVDDGSWKKRSDPLECAYHEAGHAVIAEACIPGSVGFITIAGNDNESYDGITILKTEPERRCHAICVSLGGKVSVELNLPRHASGCASDIRKACDLIDEGIAHSATAGYDGVFIDCHASGCMDWAKNASSLQCAHYETIDKHILLTNRDFLKDIVDELMKKGYVLRSDIDKFLSVHPLDRSVVTHLI